MSSYDSLENFPRAWSRELPQYRDSRGRFMEIFQKSTSQERECPEMLLDSISESEHNVIRGMHIQIAQWQQITILKGIVNDLMIDLNPDSETYLKHYMQRLDSSGVNQLLISPGIAHGFQVLSDSAIMSYKCSKYYGETSEYVFNVSSPEIAPFFNLQNSIQSERDLLAPQLSELLETQGFLQNIDGSS